MALGGGGISYERGTTVRSITHLTAYPLPIYPCMVQVWGAFIPPVFIFIPPVHVIIFSVGALSQAESRLLSQAHIY